MTNNDLQNITQKTKDLQNITQKTKDLQNITQKTKDLQNITQKTKDGATRNKLNTGDELLCSGRVGSSCSTSGTRHHTIVANPILHRKYSLLY
jgi:hypothetical protein